MKETVLITGCSGFIGSAIARRLVKNYQIVGLDRDDPKQKIPGVDYRRMDISSEASIAAALAKVREEWGSKVASVIHLAAFYSFSGEEDPKYEAITVKGTENFLWQLRKFFSVEQFIFSSTMLVHAPTEPGKEISEKSQVAPSWPYPQSKVDAERAISETRDGVPVVNLRIAGVYDDTCHSIPIAQHIARIFERQMSSLLFPGDASHGQAFLHVEDLVEAVSLLVEKRKTLPKDVTLLLGEDEPLSYRDLQGEIGRNIHGRDWPIVRVPEFIAKAGAYLLERTPFVREPFIKPWMIEYADEHYDLDIGNARKLIGWEPKRSLRGCIPKMVSALKANPEKWYKEHKIKKPPLRAFDQLDLSKEKTFTALAVANIFFGLWLISSPFTLDVDTPAMFWSDFITGVLITVVSALTLAPTLRWLRWVNASLAVWLMFSPLVFWTGSSAVYSTNTLLASLVLLASAYLPSRVARAPSVSHIPEGWTYNPSSWPQRLPIMTLAFIGFLAARYLAAFQLGHISNAWDPFFGDGTERILTSDVSRAFPISDAGLGAVSYLLDVLTAGIGDQRRWKTAPWIVVLFGFLIIPSGVTSITLVILQPVAVGEWCTVCLFTALIMLLMVPPAVDEVVASAQFLAKSKREGKPFWRTFFLGDHSEVLAIAPKRVERKRFPAHLAVGSAIGTWLLFVPWLFGISGIAATNIYIAGALIITFAVIAFSQVARVVRLANVPLGLWLAVSAWFFGEMGIAMQWHSVVMGLLVGLFSLPRGGIAERFGSLDRLVRWSPVPARKTQEEPREKRRAA